MGPEVKDARKGDFMITVRIPEQYYDAPDDGKKKKKGAEEEGKDEQNDPGDEPIIALLVSPASAVGERVSGVHGKRVGTTTFLIRMGWLGGGWLGPERGVFAKRYSPNCRANQPFALTHIHTQIRADQARSRRTCSSSNLGFSWR